MAKITYTDKSAIIVDPVIEDTFKIKAEDVNEIKTVVNTNADVQVSSSDASVRNIRYLTKSQFKAMKDSKTFQPNTWYQVDGNEIIASTSTPCGAIMHWPGKATTIPDEFMICDGRSLKVAEYDDLFAVIGYDYGGSGDNFNIPDYRDRFFVGLGTETEFNTLYKKGGHKLLQSHTHGTNVTDFYYYGWRANDTENTIPPNAPTSGGRPWSKLSISEAGGGDGQNLPPYVVGYYIIKVKKDLYSENLKNLDSQMIGVDNRMIALEQRVAPDILVCRNGTGTDWTWNRTTVGTEQLNLNNIIYQTGTGLTMINNGVRVNQGVTLVAVSGIVEIDGPATLSQLHLNKNPGGTMMNSAQQRNGGQWAHILPRMVIPVQEGDTFNLSMYNGLASTSWLMRSSRMQITFEVVSRLTSTTIENDSGWITLSLSNSWTVRSANSRPVRIRKINNVVYLEGTITGGTWQTTAFTLPEGMRPSGNYGQFIVRAGAGLAVMHLNYQSTNSGIVAFENRGGDNGEISFFASFIASS